MNPNTSQEGGNAYQLGMMAEAVRQNTQTLLTLVEEVKEGSRMSTRLSNRQDRMELTIEQIQADQRKMMSISVTGQRDEMEIKKRWDWVETKYQAEAKTDSVREHGRKIIYGMIISSLVLWGVAAIKEYAVSQAVAEVATQLRNQTEIRNKG